MGADNWVVFLLRSVDDSLYCGITNKLEKRLLKHTSGKCTKYTRSRLPLQLVGVSSKMTKSAALKLEYCLKRTPTPDKIAALERLNTN
ncbi:GIY-YIG nuclease family protein [Desulfatitalea tepidiphila]|uniref:GIY-YIG nuclease family protein n=1 Tax=Desulfatitalea tepidiphila TaxID=1185843 RepID=UPI00097686CD|nr:GIY-YIG nuclease family protein [Desulfatitalea tepidiphila]